MPRIPHGVRLTALMIAAAGILFAVAARTDVIFADGLRYIQQAQHLADGSIRDGLFRSVDHPLYPVLVAAVHAIRGGQGPLAWQSSAQLASILAGVLLAIPLYLVAGELFGWETAWLGCLLVFLTPLNGRVWADALSESTFLLFWCWALWSGLRFLRAGAFVWLFPLVVFAGLAYLTRPEGLLLPLAMAATLFLLPLWRRTRLPWRCWLIATGFLVLAPACLIGPYVAIKGGLGTKPAIARILGTAPGSPADAVERARPLAPGQSRAKTYVIAVKATVAAVREAVSTPLVPLSILGLFWTLRRADQPRVILLLLLLGSGALLALIRLHATGGYCTGRHAMILGLLLIPASAAGLARLGEIVAKVVSLRLPIRSQAVTRGLAVGLALVLYLAWSGPTLFRPLNETSKGYRLAGDWLAENTRKECRIVDLTGWSLFYGERNGYNFSNVAMAGCDPDARYVVVRQAHIIGPWGYCATIRSLVGPREPVAMFPEPSDRRVTTVLIFDRNQPPPDPVELAVTRDGHER